jgi:selenide,water dikinase
LLTVDFFTPIVDDPYDFGRITAANALSDIYAMGGRPLTAMNMVAFPCSLGPQVVADVLRGGGDVCRQAGAIVVGGHTIDDAEPKFGLAVVGTVDPARVLMNRGARVGDALVLTKPIGLGVISTALKRDAAPPELVATAIRVMTTLNADARDAALALSADDVHAATDVTGFGLLGHLRELLVASGLAADLDARAVPVIEGARALVADGMVAGGTQRNHAFVDDSVEWNGLAREEQFLLADAQTSGGLLFAVAPGAVDALGRELDARGTLASAVIGRTRAGTPGTITVRG